MDWQRLHLIATLTADTISYQVERGQYHDAMFNLSNVKGINLYQSIKKILRTEYKWNAFKGLYSNIEKQPDFFDKIERNQYV